MRSRRFPCSALPVLLAAGCSQPSDERTAEALAALTVRVDRLEKMLESPRGPSGSRDERSVVRRLEALEAARAGGHAATSPAGGGGTEGPGSPAAPAPVKAPLPQGAPDPALFPEVSAGIAADAGAPEHRAAVRRIAEFLVKSAGPPPQEKEFTWAAAMIDREARRERIAGAEAEDMANVLLGLAPGHAARVALAKAVAIGWGNDERLGGFLPRIASNAEPDLHRGVLSVLDDEHPSPAYSEYILRLVKEERDPKVLASALDLDRMEAAATAAAAKGLAQAVESRLLDGGLDANMRSRAGLAIGVACLRAPEIGVEMLRRLATKESDAKVAEEYRKAAASLAEGNATLKSLEQLFKFR